jgi:hypothetical protein
MKRNIITFIALIGFVGLFSNCEKDGTELTMKEDVTAPTLQLPASLALTRDNGGDTLTFIGTPVDPGYTASATYYLEACPEGDGFENVTELYNGATSTAMKFTVNQLNQKLLDAFPEDATSSIDFRLRSVLTVDAGTGAPGTGSDPFEYTSTTQNSAVTLYGLLRLDLVGSGMTQKIVSPASDGKYEGLVKLDPAQAFTLLNPETSTSYGGSGGMLTVDGAGITVSNAGWHLLSADIEGLTYDPAEYFIAIVGDATGSWDDDQDMEYDPETKQWFITIDLEGGKYIKFRRNDGWDWNMGLADGEEGGLTGDLKQGGVGNDIPIAETGNYTVYFTIINDDAVNGTGKYEIIKN